VTLWRVGLCLPDHGINGHPLVPLHLDVKSGERHELHVSRLMISSALEQCSSARSEISLDREGYNLTLATGAFVSGHLCHAPNSRTLLGQVLSDGTPTGALDPAGRAHHRNLLVDSQVREEVKLVLVVELVTPLAALHVRAQRHDQVGCVETATAEAPIPGVGRIAAVSGSTTHAAAPLPLHLPARSVHRKILSSLARTSE
jgi:hypothetical protein